MQELKFSCGLWVLGGCADRFCRQGYSKFLSVEDQINLAGQVVGLRAIECHQSDFDEISVEHFIELLKTNNLSCSNVNTNVWSFPKWKLGAFAHRDVILRSEAINEGKRAVEIARQVGSPSIGLWLGSDGFDYPFQVDYIRQWDSLVAAIKEVAEFASPDIKVGIEYKLKEPRAHMTIGSVGKALSICLELDMKNVGVALDFGHALMSKENPADSVALLAKHNKLFNVHFNDAYGEWDDDMIVGTVHLWQTLEFLYYCKHTGYDGWFGLDMFPYREDGVKAASMSIANIKAMWKLLDKISPQELSKAQETMDAIATQEVIRKVIFQ